MRILQNREVKLSEVLLISIVMLYIIDFYRVGIYSLILFTPFILIYAWNKNFTKLFYITLSILALFTFFFTIIIYGYNIQTGISGIFSYLFFPITTYILGYSLSIEDYKYKKTHIIIIMLLVFVNLFILFSYLRTLSDFGSLEAVKEAFNSRRFVNIWDGSPLKATEITLYLSFGIALFPTLFIGDTYTCKKRIYILKFISLLSFVNGIFLSLQLGSRTAIIIIIFSFFTVFLLFQRLSIRKIMVSFISVITLFFAWILFNLNILGLKSWWEKTSTYSRFKELGLESSRYEAWTDILQGLINQPLGGRGINLSISYAHNLWLDVAYDAGLFPFILLILFSLISLVSFIKFTLLNHPIYLKALIIALFTAFFVSFLSEPILQGGERYYFVAFCLIVGVIQGLNKSYMVKSLSKKPDEDSNLISQVSVKNSA